MPSLPVWTAGSITTPPHPYGVDGEAASLVIDNDLDGNIETGDGDKVYVYTGLRRGGAAYYALDVSTPTQAPSGLGAGTVPSLLWKIEQTSGGDFDELALSFSTPKIAKVNYSGTEQDVVIFTAGYNGGWSGGSRIGKDAGSGADSVGNAVYIVDAETGSLVWKAVQAGSTTNQAYVNSAMTHSFPSAVSTFDSNGNGIVDRLYVGDSGGALWRLDLPEGSGGNHRRDHWKATVLADLGDGSGASDHRFFHAPDIVNTRDGFGNYHGVIISSGNRADPLETTVSNYLYLIKDRTLVSGAAIATIVDETNISTADNLVDITDLCVSGVETACTSANLTLGWKLEFEANGEKGLAAPLTTNGIIYATSYLPEGGTGSTCEPKEGSGRLYAVSLKDGSVALPLSATINGDYKENRYTDIGPGIPPGAKPLGDQILLPGTGIDGNQIIDAGGRSRWRIYWRETGIDRL
jgi:type IV pilus assembly protein PilY1